VDQKKCLRGARGGLQWGSHEAWRQIPPGRCYGTRLPKGPPPRTQKPAVLRDGGQKNERNFLGFSCRDGRGGKSTTARRWCGWEQCTCGCPSGGGGEVRGKRVVVQTGRGKQSGHKPFWKKKKNPEARETGKKSGTARTG